MSFQIGDKVRIVNPNNPDFGLEGVVEGIRGGTKGNWQYQVMSRQNTLTFKYRWAYEYEIELIKETKTINVKIDKDGIVAEGLWSFNNTGLAIKKSDNYNNDAIDSLKYYIENKEGEKDNMKILDIYEDRKSLEIAKKCKEEIEKVKSEDAFESLRLNTEKQVKALYKNEFNKEFSGIICFESDCEARLLTAETKEKLRKLEQDKKIGLEELDRFLEEVRAQLELAKDYDTQMKILKRYNIIGKDGKINA